MPLWNPYQGAGAPHAANMQSAVFDPLLLGVNLHPTPLTWDLSIIGAFVLGAAAAYLFGRSARPSGGSGGHQQRRLLPGGLVLPVQQQPASAVHTSICRCYVYSWSSRCAPADCGPCSGSELLSQETSTSGMPEASFFVLGAAAVYAMVRLVQQRERDAAPPLTRSTRRRRLARPVARLAAPPAVRAVRVSVLQPSQGRTFGQRFAGGPVVGHPQLDRSLLLGRTEPKLGGASPSSGTGSAWRSGSRLWPPISGRKETKRLHAWLFLGLGAFLLVKIYDFGMLDWVGAVAGRRSRSSFPCSRRP